MSGDDGVDCIVLGLVSYGTLWRQGTRDSIVMSSAYYFNSHLQISESNLILKSLLSPPFIVKN